MECLIERWLFLTLDLSFNVLDVKRLQIILCCAHKAWINLRVFEEICSKTEALSAIRESGRLVSATSYCARMSFAICVRHEAFFTSCNGEVLWWDPSCLCGSPVQVTLHQKVFIELFVFKEHILLQSVPNSLLFGDWTEMETLHVTLKRLRSSELKWLYCAHCSSKRQESTRIGLSLGEALIWCLVLCPNSEILWRYTLLLLIFAEHVSLNSRSQGLFCISKTYAQTK